jgi:hypothetical protein
MAVRAAFDLVIGLVVVSAVAFAAVTDREPPMPDELCSTDEPPATDGRLAIVVANLRAPGDTRADPNTWSARELARLYPTADLVTVPDNEFVVAAAIGKALRDHEVVYYTGHNFGGRLSFVIPSAPRTLIMDTCYSTQLYARYARDGLDLVTNDKMSVTGSIETLPLVLRGASFDEINARAEARAAVRPPASKLRQAEHYRRVTAATTAGRSRS